MKYLCALLFIIFAVSCRSKNAYLVGKQSQETERVCPENGICVLQNLPNKTLQVKKSDLEQIDLEIVNGENLVLKFEYNKRTDKALADGSYREEVFLELPLEILNDDSTELDLANHKIYFARWCYCKGQTGYYKIKEGSGSLTKLGGHRFRLSLKFKVSEVPQIITEINEVFSLQ